MTKKLFTEEEVQALSKNRYVKSVNQKGIIYTNEFKHVFIEENEKVKPPRIIFEECGFDIDVIGLQRIVSSGNRLRTSYKEKGV
ncbi:transposase [Bacillus thuringiensis serovar andalousiensis BGSC 4AW1]|nr:transposase [Bacillus thuringiensis serovar andalousiensis BGSC 4AW1]